MIFTYMGAVGSRPLGGKLASGCGSHGEELLCGWMYKLCRKERGGSAFLDFLQIGIGARSG